MDNWPCGLNGRGRGRDDPILSKASIQSMHASKDSRQYPKAFLPFHLLNGAHEHGHVLFPETSIQEVLETKTQAKHTIQHAHLNCTFLEQGG
mgnify:CR=1 FL=1